MVHVVLPVMLASILPFVVTGIAKVRGGFSKRDNHETRAWQAKLQGWQQRATWAQQNAFETLPIFIGAAILAYIAAPGSLVATVAAWSYPAFRIAYSYFYIKDMASARSLVWLLSMFATVALFIVALTGHTA